MITVWTYDWVPNGPRGHVRDIRLRWALEEAGLDYVVKSVPFDGRGPDHIARQPFGQIPFIDDGEVTLFESGACLLYIARKSEVLMPRDGKGEADVTQWLIAALNSVEMVSVPWWFIDKPGQGDNPLGGWLRSRFERLDAALGDRDWFAQSGFSVADIMMADTLRVPLKRGALDTYPKLIAYVERALARPAFKKAYDDQLAHFAAGDRARAS
ncbi:glutathione S-transferase family protein [Pelagibacterium luteolum]|uniref:Glutathione S-transferase n=1 Tax=Pelagibacterium luteolum TaxID=440168 RepID=A0A1G7Y4P6_9HYPH|nr:glutathione S-transferase family protein [Pelagibacterium luteolum]SDG91425.1 glutathione S-transferase [Pelagibacterium luteolum]